MTAAALIKAPPPPTVRELYPSITAAYGRLTPAQRNLVARVWNGEDVRFYSRGVNHTVAHSLLRKRILDCHATTCRFSLVPPANGVRGAEGL